MDFSILCDFSGAPKTFSKTNYILKWIASKVNIKQNEHLFSILRQSMYNISTGKDLHQKTETSSIWLKKNTSLTNIRKITLTANMIPNDETLEAFTQKKSETRNCSYQNCVTPQVLAKCNKIWSWCQR